MRGSVESMYCKRNRCNTYPGTGKLGIGGASKTATRAPSAEGRRRRNLGSAAAKAMMSGGGEGMERASEGEAGGGARPRGGPWMAGGAADNVRPSGFCPAAGGGGVLGFQP